MIDPMFVELDQALPPLIDTAIDRQTASASPAGPFPSERQEALARTLISALEFDFGRGRIDVSAHPFTGGVTNDTRMTTRYNPDDFCMSMFAVLHETGHALYQQGLPDAWAGQPIGDRRRHGIA